MTATLMVSVDTEEEFDWSAPVSPQNRSVRHVADLPRLQELFESCGVRPTYLVDHPIASTDESIDVLRGFLRRGACEIGAHIHPWVNPPVVEEICPRNTYLCNLPLTLQQEKVAELTRAIGAAFGARPTSFKAGRYGLDFALVPTLHELGYAVDSSVIAFTSFADDGGPTFERFGPEPLFLRPPLVPAVNGDDPVVEIPCTVGFTRRPFQWWAGVQRKLSQNPYRKLRLVGVCWHLGVFRKIVLSPELSDRAALVRLMQIMAADRDAVLNLTLHSPSVQAGHTPFVRDREDLETFFAALRGALEFAMRELGTRALTLSEFGASYRRNHAR